MTLTPEQSELRRSRRTRLDAARLLVDLEEEAFYADLPLLDWQISVAGLTGHTRPEATPQEREAAFTAWAGHLQAALDEPVERTWPTHSRVLRGHVRVPRPTSITGTVRVVLFTEIDLETEEEGTDAP